VSTADAGTYTVVVSGTSPCSPVTSQNAVLNVNQAVAISVQPATSQTVCSGTNVSFGVTATGTGLTYQWRKGTTNLTNGGNISGVNTATLTLTGALTGDAGSYNVIVSGTSPCGAVTSSDATLVVNQVVAISTQPATSQTVCSGFPVSFSVSATGTGLTYQWKKNGTNISGATSNMYSISNVSTLNAGNYTVEVSGTNTLQSCNFFYIRINSEPGY